MLLKLIRIRSAWPFAVAALLLLLLGCGGGNSTNIPSPSPTPALTGPEFVYVGPSSTAEILIFPVDLSTGALGAPSSIAPPNTIVGSVADPGGKVLYAADFQNASMHEYSINGSTGALSEFPGSPFPAQSSFGSSNVYVDTQNKFIYEDNCGLARSSSGALTQIASTCLPSVQSVRSAVDPTDRFVIQACQDRDFPICVAALDPTTGLLQRTSSVPMFNFTPHDVAVTPSGSFIYVSGLFDPSAPGAPPDPHERVLFFTLDRNSGILNQFGQLEFGTRLDVTTMAMHPSGKFIYVSDSANVFGFSINSANGTLTPVSGSPFPGHLQFGFSSTLRVDPSGQFLYLAADDINAIAGYKIDSTTGALTSVPGSPFAVGGHPLTMTVVRTP